MNRFPLIAKWLPGLELQEPYRSDLNVFVDAEDLERELGRGVVLGGYKSKAAKDDIFAWGENLEVDDSHTGLLIGTQLIVKDRVRSLSESQVRDVVTSIDWASKTSISEEIISRLFGDKGET